MRKPIRNKLINCKGYGGGNQEVSTLWRNIDYSVHILLQNCTNRTCKTPNERITDELTWNHMVFLRISILPSEHLEHEAQNWIQLHFKTNIIKCAICIVCWPPVKSLLKQTGDSM